MLIVHENGPEMRRQDSPDGSHEILPIYLKNGFRPYAESSLSTMSQICTFLLIFSKKEKRVESWCRMRETMDRRAGTALQNLYTGKV